MYLPAFSHHAPVNNITYSGACFCASYWGGDPQDPWIFCCLHGICHVFLPSVGTPEDSPLQMTLTRLQFFKESGEGREGTREKYHCVIVSRVPPTPGVCLLLQACASTGNQTGDPLVHRPVLNPLSHSSQGYSSHFSNSFCLSFWSLWTFFRLLAF